MPLHPVDPLEQDERDALAAEARKIDEKRDGYIDGLNDLAGFLAFNRNLIPGWGGVSVLIFPDPEGDETKVEAFKRMASQLPDAKLESPTSSNGYYTAEIKFGPHDLRLLLAPADLDPTVLPPHPLAGDDA